MPKKIQFEEEEKIHSTNGAGRGLTTYSNIAYKNKNLQTCVYNEIEILCFFVLQYILSPLFSSELHYFPQMAQQFWNWILNFNFRKHVKCYRIYFLSLKNFSFMFSQKAILTKCIFRKVRFNKTLPKPTLQMHWISVRFYEIVVRSSTSLVFL